MSISRSGKDGQQIDAIVSERTTGSGKLSDTDTFDQSDWESWTMNEHDLFGKLEFTRAYHTIPPAPGESSSSASSSSQSESPSSASVSESSSSGEYSEYYDQTDYGYDSLTGAQIRVAAPSAPGNPGTITRTVYDQMGRQESIWAGT